jgi:ribosomal protein S18 acetylase RimI-like enzyme
MSKYAAETLRTAVRANALGFYITQGQSPLCHLEENERFLRLMSEIAFPIGNAIFGGRFDGTEAEIIEQVRLALNPFRVHQLPMVWITDWQTQPTNLGALLKAEGLFNTPPIPGMAAEIAVLDYIHPPTVPIEIRRVETPALMQGWLQVFEAVFGIPADAAAFWYETLVSLGLTGDVPLRHYVALLDGHVLGTASLLLWENSAGIYNVSTLQHMRQRGIGSALTLEPLRETTKLGYEIAVLQSSDMAQGLYRRLGFQTLGQFNAYVWMGDMKPHR